MPFDVRLDDLAFGEGVRGSGLDEAHVAVLVESGGSWPPIVVWGDENQVVDGHHRVAAARCLGRSHLTAVRLVGSIEDAYVESVRGNVQHGLPLSLTDRRRAARRLLSCHAMWSDRRIAALCGLSGKTIARLRREVPGRGADGDAVVIGIDARIGGDGRTRPARSDDVRARIRRALDENPTGSLRSIAAAAGASPETVRSVRGRCHPAETPAAAPEPSAWQQDRALTSSAATDGFARWFTATHVTDEWRQHVWTIPIGRIYEVADESRRRAARWTEFASLLECRLRS